VRITKSDLTRAITEFETELNQIFTAETRRQYTWDPTKRSYYHEGQRVSKATVYSSAEFYNTNAREKIAQIDLTSGWLSSSKEQIKREYIRQYLIGRGGLDQMTPADWGRIGGYLREKYQFLNLLEQSGYSNRMILSRLEAYIDSAHTMFELARAKTYAMDLPAYPGDGSTECHWRCRCTWDYQEEKGTLVAYWTLGPVKTEHCVTCLERSTLWNPFILGGI
jgi:hypothetical protein